MNNQERSHSIAFQSMAAKNLRSLWDVSFAQNKLLFRNGHRRHRRELLKIGKRRRLIEIVVAIAPTAKYSLIVERDPLEVVAVDLHDIRLSFYGEPVKNVSMLLHEFRERDARQVQDVQSICRLDRTFGSWIGDAGCRDDRSIVNPNCAPSWSLRDSVLSEPRP
jgi:hypothetical protein